MTGKFLVFIFSIASLGLLIFYLYRETNGDLTVVERLLILGPMFLSGFVATGVVYFLGKRRLRDKPEELSKFVSSFYTLILLYGATFVAFMVWIIWELMKK